VLGKIRVETKACSRINEIKYLMIKWFNENEFCYKDVRNSQVTFSSERRSPGGNCTTEGKYWQKIMSEYSHL
jgi:hypothetical protein